MPDVLRMAALALAASLATGAGCRDESHESDDMTEQRHEMVRAQIQARGIHDPRVLDAMRDVKRHLFVPTESTEDAYEDFPLPIGEGQTISQPYIVALMTDLLETKPTDHVLEVGTGSGYQAAVLSRLVADVYSIEIVKSLSDVAAKRQVARPVGDAEGALADDGTQFIAAEDRADGQAAAYVLARLGVGSVGRGRSCHHRPIPESGPTCIDALYSLCRSR